MNKNKSLLPEENDLLRVMICMWTPSLCPLAKVLKMKFYFLVKSRPGAGKWRVHVPRLISQSFSACVIASCLIFFACNTWHLVLSFNSHAMWVQVVYSHTF